MATITYEVPYLKKTSQKYRVRIRLTHKRVKRYIQTDIYLGKDQITPKGKISNIGKKQAIQNVISYYETKIENINLKLDAMDCDEVLQYITRPDKDEAKNASIDFIKFGMPYDKKPGYYNTSTALNSLIKYFGRESIDINELTSRTIRKYAKWLVEREENPVRGRGVSLYLNIIKKLILEAKLEYNDEDLSIYVVKVSPFDYVKVPGPPETQKRSLDIVTIRAIRDLKEVKEVIKWRNHGRPLQQKEVIKPINEVKRAQIAKDVWLLSFYLIGMNTVDLYYADRYDGRRLTYNRRKIESRMSDKGIFSVLVPEQAQYLLEKYKGDDGRVFNFHNLYNTHGNFNSAVNKGMKIIGEQLGNMGLTFGSARHSWATIARNDCGISKEVVHGALNHSDKSMKVTDIYIRKIYKPFDEANKTVLTYLFSNRVEQLE